MKVTFRKAAVMLITAMLALGLAAGITACKTEPDEPELTKIEVTAKPSKTEYFVGEALNLAGLKVTAVYSDGTKEVVTKDAKLSGFDSSAAADSQTVTVTYEGKTATFTVKITAVEVTKIELTSEPAKKEYFVGDSIDLTDIKVTATYNNGTTADVTDDVEASGFNSSAAAESQKITVTYEGKTATFTVKISAVEVTKIELTSEPEKKEYFVGETLDLTGLKVTATYNNGKTKDVTDDVEASCFDSSAAADSQKITVTYEGKTATFTVKISAVEVTKIELTSEPEKKEYFVGETLDKTGLKVTATYNNGKTEDVTKDAKLSGFDSSAAAESQKITVTYEGKTATFKVKITAVELTGITVTTKPTKTEYIVGEKLDLAGLKVTAAYNNGKTEDVTASVTTDFDLSTAAESKTVTVTYGGKTATFTVKIIAVEVAKIELTSEPAKKEYFVGEALDLKGLKVTATYNNGKTEDVTDEVEASGFDSRAAADSQTVTVTYEGKTATFTVKIKALEVTKIELTSEPAKKEYFVGEALNLAGIKVTATYNNGTIADVTSSVTISGFDSSEVTDSQTVTVTYESKSAAFTVKIKAIELTGIIVSTKPTKIIYFVGDDINLTGLKVTAKYNNGKTADVTSSVTTSGFDSSEVTDSQEVTVSYEGKTAVFTVRIIEPVLMTVNEFITALGTAVEKITYDTTKPAGVTLSTDGKTANVYGVKLSGAFSDSTGYRFPTKLVTADLRGLDTSGVTSMSFMFYCCSKLTSLDVSSFDTSSVTNMSYMFDYCSKLTSLDLSSFDTSKVTNMGCMFYECESLTSLDVRRFNTSSVTNMSYMFSSCTSLTGLDVSSFDTSSVTNMRYMFYYCSKLTSLDLSNFDTSSVTDMNNMFDTCKSLTSLDLSSFDTSSVTKMLCIFQHCSSLTSLDVSGFNTSKVTNMIGMFLGCSKLTSLDLSSFDTSSVTSKDKMFQLCGTSETPLAVTYSTGWTLGTEATLLGATNLSFTLKQ